MADRDLLRPRTVIVDLWSTIFEQLSYVSIFSAIRGFFPSLRRSYVFVEVWVMGNTFLAGIVLVIAGIRIGEPITVLFIVVMFYGALRVFEIMVYQINVLLFDEYRAAKQGRRYAVRGFRRLVLLLIHNYFEILFWFSAAYVFLARAGHLRLETYSFLSILRQSLVFMVAFAGDGMRPVTHVGALLVLIQTCVGVFMTIVVLARFLTLLPTPESMDELDEPRTEPSNRTQPPT